MSAKKPGQPTGRYIVADLLAASAALFGVHRDVAEAALAGKGPMTVDEAKAAVKEFISPTPQDIPAPQAAPAPQDDKPVEGGTPE